MSLLLLFPGIQTPDGTPPPPPVIVSASAGGTITFGPPRRSRKLRREIIQDVIRVPNYNEVIQLEDEEWVILLQ